MPILLLLLFFYCSVCQAQLPQVWLWQETLSSDSFWNRHGKKQKAYNHLKKTALQALVQQTLSKDEEVYLKAGYDKIDESINGKTKGFEDFELAYRSILYRSQCLDAGFKAVCVIPVVQSYKPPLHYGLFGVELGPFVTKAISSNTCSYFYLGYRAYHGFASDQLRANLCIDHHLLSSVHLTLALKARAGLCNKESHPHSNNSLYSPSDQLLTGYVQGVYRCNGFLSLMAAYYQHLHGKNVATGHGFFTGIKMDF